MAFVLPSLLLGILGSFHCIGMCGPIALSLPVQHLSGASKFGGILLYNAGRIITYSLLGCLFGLIGLTFDFFGWQQILSVLIGSLFLLFFAGAVLRKQIVRTVPGVDKWNRFLIARLAPLFHKKGSFTLLFTGLLNGLLPCGLIYMAIAGAVATGSIVGGSLFMAFFGLGTLPAMLAMSYAGSLITVRMRSQMKKSIPYVMAVMGILLILRGMNLNIPYLSPAMVGNAMQSCH